MERPWEGYGRRDFKMTTVSSTDHHSRPTPPHHHHHHPPPRTARHRLVNALYALSTRYPRETHHPSFLHSAPDHALIHTHLAMVTILLILSVLLLIVILDITFTKLLYRLSQRPRFEPTIFHSDHLPLSTIFPAPAKPFRRLQGTTNPNIDDRYEFIKPLGNGCEGCTAIYRDTHRGNQLVVIKSFFQGVRTNPLPEHLRTHFRGEGSWNPRGRWPSEIPSTLYFTSINAPGEFHMRDDGRRLNGGFVYALDYFWVEEGVGGWWWPGGGMRHAGRGWRLVTPFLSYGTLETLAALLRKRGCAPDEVDRVYRRRYRGILEALAMMHEAGYTHDDVKLDNIFISPTNTFLLGDLGNVREHDHAFHHSSIAHSSSSILPPSPPSASLLPSPPGLLPPPTTAAKQQQTQGIADVTHAIRTYLTFLRLSSGRQEWFDDVFSRPPGAESATTPSPSTFTSSPSNSISSPSTTSPLAPSCPSTSAAHSASTSAATASGSASEADATSAETPTPASPPAPWRTFYWRFKSHPRSARELLDKDPFWAAGGVGDDPIADAFEAEVALMRLDRGEVGSSLGRSVTMREGGSGAGAGSGSRAAEKERGRLGVVVEEPEKENESEKVGLRGAGNDEVGTGERLDNAVLEKRRNWSWRSEHTSRKEASVDAKEVEKMVDGELACVALGVCERLLLGQGRGGMSMYCAAS
ncbi:hypothetical protein EX30DRAFT_389926 [Ascodesmis nigricans]|uniref:Protein kinase domain-containing protein n=1 Tax=Ascodesmis nigricans TaxID=341454 RepID=A0A4S2MIJ7_9PEZI|nr:hypothetical protein EX30DRAFT_389926 [Ascodesmis nigricans]